MSRLSSLVRSLIYGSGTLLTLCMLMSATWAPHHWDWDDGDHLVPLDIAQHDDTGLVNPDDQAAVDVTTRGAVGDGTTCNTAVIQATIDHLGPAGGTVRFPAGRFVTGTIRLHDNVTLWLDRDAVLLGSLDPAEYHLVHACGIRNCMLHGAGLIVANHAHHIGIVGRGTIDGRGAELAERWAQLPTPIDVQQSTLRPFLCRWMGCQDVTVSGVTFVDPANWVQHFHRCGHVRLDRLTVLCENSPNGNTDGIDVDSCHDVRVTRCDIRSGDDAICLKTTSPAPCRDVIIEDCRLTTRCNGIKFGTESVGPFEHVRVRRCQMTNVGMAGVAIFSVDGAAIRDVVIANVHMRTVRTPIAIRLGSRLASFHPGDGLPTVGSIQGITIRHLQAVGAERTGIMVSGLPNAPVGPLTLNDVHIGLTGGVPIEHALMSVRELPGDYPQDDMFGHYLPASGVYLRHVRGLSLGSDVTTDTEQPDARPARVRVDVEP